MAARPLGNFQQALRSYWSRWSDPTAFTNVLRDINNNTPLTYADSGDSTSIAALNVDTDSRIVLDSAAQLGLRQSAQFVFAAAGGLLTQAFFIAPRAMVITGIEEIHSVAGDDAAAVTAVVTHGVAGNAPGAGTVVQTNSFNLKGTANTVQTATLLAVDGFGRANAGISLAKGDTLSLKLTGTPTTLAGVVLTVFFTPGAKEVVYEYNMLSNGSIATQSFGLANRDLVVTSVQMTWSAKATNGGAVTIDVTADTTTTAPGGGTSVLAAAQSVKGAINTPVTVALSATPANLVLRAGTRLSIKTAGTLTALAGLVVTVTCGPVGALAYIGENEATFTMLANGSLAAAQGVFLADRDYEVVDVSAVWSVAGTDGGTVTYDVTIDKGVVAPGAGVSVLASGSAVSVKGTANTVSAPGVQAVRSKRLMSQGDLLSVKLNGILTSLAGVTVTAELKAI